MHKSLRGEASAKMGQSMSWLSGLLWAKKEIRILILGLVWSGLVRGSESGADVLTLGQRWQDNTTVQTQGWHTPSLPSLYAELWPLTHRVQIGEVVTTIPTIGFNVESVTYKNLNFNVWV